jgi:hypothetical protein
MSSSVRLIDKEYALTSDLFSSRGCSGSFKKVFKLGLVSNSNEVETDAYKVNKHEMSIQLAFIIRSPITSRRIAVAIVVVVVVVVRGELRNPHVIIHLKITLDRKSTKEKRKRKEIEAN